MRVPGYCRVCRRFRVVDARAPFVPLNAPEGICDECAEKEDKG